MHIDENMLRKMQAAVIIAKSLGYHPPPDTPPLEIITQAIANAQPLTPEQQKIVENMRQLAEEVDEEEQDPDSNWSEEKLDALAAEVDEVEDVVDVYDADELHLIDDETGEVVDDLKEDLTETELNEVLSRIERIRARVRFHKSASKRQRKLKIALKRHSNNSQINARARKLAIILMKKRIAKKPLNKLNVAEKERLEKIIKRRKPIINRLALKLTSRIRMIEKNRLSHRKA